MNRLAEAVIRLRIPIIVATVLLTALFGYFVKDIRIDPDILGYLPENDPVNKLNTYISDAYGGSQMAVVALESQDVFSEDTLNSVLRLTSRFQLVEGVRHVTSLTNLIDIKKVEDWLEVGRLIDPARLPQGEEELRSLREYTLGKDMYRGRLVSPDGRSTVIVCRLREHADETRVAAEIQRVVEEENLEENVYYAGLPFQMAEIGTLVRHDLIKLAPLAALLIAACLFLGLRSLRGMLLPLLSASIAGVWVVGIMSLCGVSFTVISNIIPVVLIAVGSAYGIHVVASFAEKAAPDAKLPRAAGALARITLPVLLAGITTVSGFMAFIFGSYLEMIREFGLFSSLGILFSLLLSLTFVPSVLSLLPASRATKSKPLRAAAPTRTDGRTPADLEAAARSNMFARTGLLVLRRRRLITAVGAILVALSVIGMPFIDREVEVLSYFKKNTQIRLSEDMMKEKFGGSTTLQILVRGNIQDPAVLGKMKSMEELLRSRPELHNVYSIVELIEEMNYAMVDRRAVPDSQAKIANLWFLLEGQDSVSQLVNDDRQEAVIQATLETMNSRVMSELIHTIRTRIDRLQDEEVTMQLGGTLLVYDKLDAALRRSQIQSLFTALLLVFLCNLILLRSLPGSLIGLIPMVFTLFILFGSMGLTGIPLDVVTVLIGSISLGIGIDYSIHFLNRFRLEYRLSGSRSTALVNTLGTTGRAIGVNMITVSLGFASLLLGSFIPLRRFALLIAVTMLSSGAGALLLLPAIMMIGPASLFRAPLERSRVLGARWKSARHLNPVRVKTGQNEENDQSHRR